MNSSTSRLRLPLAVAAATSLLLAGCTGTTPPDQEQDASGPQTIKWLIEEPEDAEALKALQGHVDAGFTKESGITVDIDTLPFDTMRTVLQTQLRSGDGPDVINWGSGPGFGGALADAGMLLDLSDAYDENGWNVYDFAKETVTTDDMVYGIPGELETIGVYYNKDKFDELGLAEPQDLGDLEAAAAAATDAGMVGMSAPNKEGWEGGHYLSMALASEAGPDEMLSIINGDESWDSAAVVSAFARWEGFNEAGYLSESPTSVDYDTGIAEFWSGDSLMLATGSWLVGELDDNADFEVGYVPFPGPDDAGTFTAGLGSGPMISASSSHQDAAVEFLDFLASEEHGTWTVENLHTIPPFPVDSADLDISPLNAQVLDTTAELAESGSFGRNIDVLVTDAINQAMYDGMQGVMTGQMTPEEAAAGMADAANS